MGVGEAEAFSERMKREIQVLEATNVYALLESENLIEEIEARNNKLELHSVNNKRLCEELDKLLKKLYIPPEFVASLTGSSFDESHMVKNIEACDWLCGAIRRLQVPDLDPSYTNMQAVREKHAELEKLKNTFVWRASEFLRNYFASLVDFMITDKTYFSQRGSLKRPDHADLRYKCRTYARLLQHLKSLDKNCLGPLRKAYCHSINLLLRREVREFANELRACTKVGKAPTTWFDSAAGFASSANSVETAALSEVYSKMLTVFIPLLVDESSFVAHFMCFEVPRLSNGSICGSDDNGKTDSGHDSGGSATELGSLNESLQELLNGIQEDFYALVDWGYKIDPLRCISMHGVTEHYLSGQKAGTTGFVRLLLDDLETRISMNFGRFVDDCIYLIEKTECNARQVGVLPYIPRFSILATRMEQYIQGESRDLVDQAYTKIVSIMFVCLERTAQIDPKYSDIILLENYAAFQNSLYDLANVVPTIAKFYHQASESYDQACTRHINMVIFITFERLFLFARRIEELMFTITSEEIQFQVGMSKADFRKMLKSSLSGLDKSINAMYKKLQKNLTSEELLPSLWEKCKKDFLDKYGSFVKLVNKIYLGESVPQVSEMRDLLTQM
ncbi:Exocyst complex component SEC3A [Platanthera guangdongensis]|uniref:Exocyst complex component SEC3A n=1 Tax=Platanthera guangdongensis TaxID=2320717 RepID=A0ABR2LKF8_9ASPA